MIRGAVLVGLAACAGPAGPATIAPPPAVEAPAPSAAPISIRPPGCGLDPRAVDTLTVGGHARRVVMVLPTRYAKDTPYPVVVALHGGGGRPEDIRRDLDLERAAGGQAIFVYPEALGGTWDLDSPAEANADVALFDAILAYVHNHLCDDPRRVFVAGFSNGAYMANQLGCRRGDLVRAVASFAGGGPYEVARGSFDPTGHLVCPGKPVATLVVDGLADKVVPASEGDKTIDHAAHANRCASSSTPWAFDASCSVIGGCSVVRCRVEGLGHAMWSRGPDAAWRFFTK